MQGRPNSLELHTALKVELPPCSYLIHDLPPPHLKAKFPKVHNVIF